MEYLKKAPPTSADDRLEIQKTVSMILAEIERDGTDAIRRYSAKFDGWDPPSFRVSPAQISEAEERVDPKLRAQIEFSRLQVERFARLQRASLIDFQAETLPGVTLGQKQIPVNSVESWAWPFWMQLRACSSGGPLLPLPVRHGGTAERLSFVLTLTKWSVSPTKSPVSMSKSKRRIQSGSYGSSPTTDLCSWVQTRQLFTVIKASEQTMSCRPAERLGTPEASG